MPQGTETRTGIDPSVPDTKYDEAILNFTIGWVKMLEANGTEKSLAKRQIARYIAKLAIELGLTSEDYETIAKSIRERDEQEKGEE